MGPGHLMMHNVAVPHPIELLKWLNSEIINLRRKAKAEGRNSKGLKLWDFTVCTGGL